MRYGCRVIRRNPLLSLVVVLTLTVGIGINASIFTVVNGMMLKPHVYKDPETFVRIVPVIAPADAFPARSPTRNTCACATRPARVRQLAAFSYFPAHDRR